MEEIEKVAPIFIVLFFSGMFGGLVGAIKKGGANHINLPFSGSRIKTGFFGDLLTGSAASLVSYTFLSIFPEQSIQINGSFLIKLFGFGILTGYAGIAILDKISLDMLNQRFDDTKKEILENQKQVLEKDKAISILNERGDYYLVIKDYALALDYYTDTLSIDENNLEAKLGVAISKNYINENDHLEPIKLLNEILDKKPEDPRALYNRACIKALNLKSYSKEDVVDDLKKAIRSKASYAIRARSDVDFDAIRGWDEFEIVVG